MATILKRTRSVLERVDLPGAPTFAQPPEADGEAKRDHFVTLDGQVWEDMGRPEAITITIEPGDQLNKASDHPVGGVCPNIG